MKADQESPSDVGSHPASKGRALKDLMAQPGIIKAPAAYSGLVAIAARRLGFRALTLSGYAMGANTGITEPLMNLTDCVARAREVMDAAPDCLLIADAGAGFGEPLHVKRTVSQFERAGVSALTDIAPSLAACIRPGPPPVMISQSRVASSAASRLTSS